MANLDMSGFWNGRRVLLTGHTGFKGAWLGLWLERLGADVVGLALPPESEDGAYGALMAGRMRSHIVDLRDAQAVDRVVAAERPEIVLHLGAQALVGHGWADPPATYATNVVGTSHLLEAVRRAHATCAVVVVTSDKVYANAGSGEVFSEGAPLGGNDPYSASKAAVEHVVTAWRAGNPGARVATARAGNVIGGGDLGAGRLLPDVWRALQAGESVRLRNPLATRPWQFVLDPIAGYVALAERLATDGSACPAALNFGPDASACQPVWMVVERTVQLWGCGGWADDHGERPPEAASLVLDASLARRVLGWRPRLTLDDALAWTIEWWRAAHERGDLRALACSQVAAFEDMQA